MADLKHITKYVKSIMELNEKARCSDSYLYLLVIKQISNERGYRFEALPMQTFMNTMNEYGLPPFESVRRARQKVQVKYPELRPCKAVAEMRSEQEKVYLEYARSEIDNG